MKQKEAIRNLEYQIKHLENDLSNAVAKIEELKAFTGLEVQQNVEDVAKTLEEF